MPREFDRSITDKSEGLRLNIARTQHSDSWVHLNIRPASNMWPRTTVIISSKAAIELARALLDATQEQETVIDRESIETAAE